MPAEHYNIGDLMHLFDKYEPNEKIIQFYATETALAITALHKVINFSGFSCVSVLNLLYIYVSISNKQLNFRLGIYIPE